MNTQINNWKLHLTVAAIIENAGKFLLVVDNTSKGLKLNQPAGHIEDNESIEDAIIREVAEETSLNFIPEKLSGIYLAKLDNNNSYLRFCFIGKVNGNIDNPKPQQNNDGVVAANWYSIEEIHHAVTKNQLRSELVFRVINDYLTGQEFPLSILAQYRNYT